MTEEKRTWLYANLMDALDRIYRAVFSMFVLVAVLVLAGVALMLLGRIVSAIPWLAVGNYLNSLLPTDLDTWRWLLVVFLLWLVLQELRAIRKLLSYEPGEEPTAKL